MLQTLRIENIAVIEYAEIEFDKGFCVLTGETGAGKSILIDSLNAVLGSRTSKEIVRNGSEKASVSAIFSQCSDHLLKELSELGFPCDDDSVLLSRIITVDGKSSCRINGLPATTSIVRKIAKKLVNIHGQQDSYILTDTLIHHVFVDRMAECDDLISSYHILYEKYLSLKKEKENINIDESEKARRMDILSFQIEELSDADITLGEMDELISRKKIMLNSEKIALALSQVHSLLGGDDEYSGAVGLVQRAADELSECSDFSEDIDQNANRLSEIGYELDNIYSDMRDIASELEFDPSELADVEERLDMLNRLSRKYGNTEEEMLEFLQKAECELEKIELSEDRLLKLDKEIEDTYKQARELAEKISKVRKETALKMQKKVKSELEFLNMPNVEFLVDIKPCELCYNGIDKVEFLISANLGEQPKPLSKIASGGELSRTMLALLSVLNDKNEAQTLIFDEIDAGISGRAADKVGQRLKKTASGRQVICITHLAQIASKSDRHYLIEKNTSGGRTITSVKLLDHRGRVEELARIIGGTVVSDLTRAAAEEMLKQN